MEIAKILPLCFLVIHLADMPMRYLLYFRISLSFHHNRLPDVLPMLKSITVERKQKMRDSLKMVFKKYLMTFEKIVLTTLKILERRIIPNSMASDDEKKSEPIEEVAK